MTSDLILLGIAALCVLVAIFVVPRIVTTRHREEALERTEAPHRELSETDAFLRAIAEAKTDTDFDRIVTEETTRRRRTD